jgi:mRNA-degrading endonuclease RelE of RelBE toxin-antitoxin system
MAKILWTKKAVKQLYRLDAKTQTQLSNGVDALEKWPNCKHVKALAGRSGYRLKVGRYRVLFRIDQSQKPVIIHIEEVKKRDERTY